MASARDQLIPYILTIQVRPQLQERGRRLVGLSDALVRDRPRRLDAPVVVVPQTRRLRHESRPRALIQDQVLRAGRLGLAHISARLNEGKG